MSSDLPFYETLYGIYVNHWKWTYGSGEFVDAHYMLTKEYLNEGCLTTDYTSISAGTNTFKFLYPYWIKKKYYIEGEVEGHFSIAANTDDGTIETYELKVMKVDDLGNTSQIGTTGVITLNYTLTWDAGLSVGDELVVPFFIDITPEIEMLDRERIYVEIIIVSTAGNLILYHSNDATWQDIKISIPFRGI